jgi:hypothetical protein
MFYVPPAHRAMLIAAIGSLFGAFAPDAEPIVITGAMVPGLIGTPISSLRVTAADGLAMPFQVDEVTAEHEFVCDHGVSSNAAEGNGVLDSLDEIVFLWEDAAVAREPAGDIKEQSGKITLIVSHGDAKRRVIVSSDRSIPMSPAHYIEYDHAAEKLTTPYYYAVFGHRRFHFVKAGVRDFTSGGFIDLTNELRIDIVVRLLWGIIPVHYTENSIVCEVERFKVGPIRLIRRGDFHLNLGLGIKGSQAAVNQICYPQVVSVPVSVHLPIRFKSVCSEAYIEMAPGITPSGRDYSFTVPGKGISLSFRSYTVIDTLVPVIPDNRFFKVDDGNRGFGWLLKTSMNDSYLSNSGFVFNMPSHRTGIGDCGYRLGLRDLPRGVYDIANWVVFSSRGASHLQTECEAVLTPATIVRIGAATVYRNALERSGTGLARTGSKKKQE